MNAKSLFSFLNRCIPKKNIILFNSFPPYADNARSIYEYLLNNRPDITARYSLIWAQDDFDFVGADALLRQGRLIRKKSLKGVWLFLRAKYVFATHGYFLHVRDGKGQCQVNLWHGCGYKDLSAADERGYRGRYNVVTNDLYQPIHSALFAIPPENVLVTGLPRNDALFGDTHGLEKLGIDRNRYRRVIIWLPTYRKATDGHDGIDGRLTGFGLADVIDRHYGDVEQVLQEQNTLLLIKTHPMDVLQYKQVPSSGHLLFVTDDRMRQCGVNLYEILPQTDVLMTDYSSVLTDYLLLDKPIVMVTDDVEAYRESRGFVFDRMEDFFAGPVVHTIEEFLDYIQNGTQTDADYEQKRRTLTQKMHRFRDGNSCRRVTEFLFGEKPE